MLLFGQDVPIACIALKNLQECEIIEENNGENSGSRGHLL